MQDIARLKHKLTLKELKEVAQETADVAFLADELTDRCHTAARNIRREILALVPKTTEEGAVGDKAKKKIRETAKAYMPLAELLPMMLDWRTRTVQLCKRIKDGKANAALIARLAYLARLSAVDPDYANRDINDLIRWLGIDSTKPNHLPSSTELANRSASPVDS